jgi:hypothetical protein
VSLGDATAFGEIVVIATCKRKHQRGITRVGEKNFAEKVIHHPSSLLILQTHLTFQRLIFKSNFMDTKIMD